MCRHPRGHYPGREAAQQGHRYRSRWEGTPWAWMVGGYAMGHSWAVPGLPWPLLFPARVYPSIQRPSSPWFSWPSWRCWPFESAPPRLHGGAETGRTPPQCGVVPGVLPSSGCCPGRGAAQRGHRRRSPWRGQPLGLDGGKVRPGPHRAAPGPRMAGRDRGQSTGRRTAPRPSWAVLVVLCLCRVSLHGITNRYTTSGRVFWLIL